MHPYTPHPHHSILPTSLIPHRTSPATMAINNKRHSASNKRTSTSNKHNSTNMTGTESNLDNTPATTTNSDDPATEIEVITDDTSTPTTPSAPSGSSADTSIVLSSQSCYDQQLLPVILQVMLR
ncbi:hypothetical protein MJO29_015980 [Puccinia striiformis f. sp. tritici]|nr:hypothetical protein MJO29_015980 [Puccinia striiformis f. sp. tritici]